MKSLPFLDLSAHVETVREELDEAIARVLSSGWYILGRELEAFETEMAAYLGVRGVAGVGSGTDAITLALRAIGVGEGDRVITTPLTAVPTVCAIVDAGARPDFVDIDRATLNIDPRRLEEKLSTGKYRAFVPVHLYGLAADLTALRDLAKAHDVMMVEDVAQAAGGQFEGNALGSLGVAGCFSFYPTKNLGALGDAGAVASNDTDLITAVKSIRNYGESAKFHNTRHGVNSRMDEMQAAILRVKLRHLDDGNRRRRELAETYHRRLQTLPIDLPDTSSAAAHVFHLFVIRTQERDKLQEYLTSVGIGSAVHYPRAVHLQPAFASLGFAPGQLPVVEEAVQQILSLPLYPEMAESHVETVCQAIEDFFERA